MPIDAELTQSSSIVWSHDRQAGSRPGRIPARG
jgi:hypothetical protein